jgi:hypothetical protein
LVLVEQNNGLAAGESRQSLISQHGNKQMVDEDKLL